MIAHMEEKNRLEDGTINDMYPWVVQNDILPYSEMLKAHDRDKFVVAMDKEVDGLRDMLQVVPRSSLPDGVKPLLATWAFK